jgi:hypothetical protein
LLVVVVVVVMVVAGGGVGGWWWWFWRWWWLVVVVVVVVMVVDVGGGGGGGGGGGDNCLILKYVFSRNLTLTKWHCGGFVSDASVFPYEYFSTVVPSSFISDSIQSNVSHMQRP